MMCFKHGINPIMFQIEKKPLIYTLIVAYYASNSGSNSFFSPLFVGIFNYPL